MATALHRLVHPDYIDGCFACKALSVAISSATPDGRDRQLSKDLDAYKRLRHDGLQPSTIDGCAEVEQRVESQMDLTLGRYVPRAEMERVREGMAISREMGLTTVVPD